MRIIAGQARSLPLAVPDKGTRPTADRVKESLFGSLESVGALAGATVLDLYAGSGALGLEAISRGAVRADLVERSARAAAVTERNARAVAAGVPEATIAVHRASAQSFLKRTPQRFDLVFLDPPYDVAEQEVTDTLALLVDRLEPGATVVVERASRSGEPVLPDGLVVERSRGYGDTTLWWLNPR